MTALVLLPFSLAYSEPVEINTGFTVLPGRAVVSNVVDQQWEPMDNDHPSSNCHNNINAKFSRTSFVKISFSSSYLTTGTVRLLRPCSLPLRRLYLVTNVMMLY